MNWTSSCRRPRTRRPGRPSLVLVGGEAGVGKSRLASGSRRPSPRSGWLVFEGGSVALGDDSLPFGPIVEALRALSRSVEAGRIAAAAGSRLPELVRLVPDLSTRLSAPQTPVDSAEWRQTQTFDAILRLLGRLAVETPILLIVEDLHWADPSTRDFWASWRITPIRTAAHHRDVPRRRTPPASPVDSVVGRGRAAASPRADRPAPVRPAGLVELLTSIRGAAPPN